MQREDYRVSFVTDGRVLEVLSAFNIYSYLIRAVVHINTKD